MADMTHVVLRTTNAKLGGGVATYRSKSTCPTTCPFYDNGCYAFSNIRTSRVADRFGTESHSEQFARITDKVKAGELVRHAVSGDVMRSDSIGRRYVDWGYIREVDDLAQERPDLDHYSYTHAWERIGDNPFEHAVFNASCETEEQVVQAADQGWDAVITVPDFEDPVVGKEIETTQGTKRVVPCPAQTHGITCEECRLCAKPNRTAVVAFAAHGMGKFKAEDALNRLKEVM